MSKDAPPRGSTRRLQFRGAIAMWMVALGLATIYVLSTLPTPLYETYRQAFGFSRITLTLIYAAYVVGTVLTMFFLGRLSDEVGRRPVFLASLALGALSTILFLLAASTVWLLAARITAWGSPRRCAPSSSPRRSPPSSPSPSWASTRPWFPAW